METGLIHVLVLLLFSALPSWAVSNKRVATFNTGLTPRVPNYEARREEILARLTDVNADVLCLQEVWYSNDLLAILDAVADKHVYPWTYSDMHNDPMTVNTPDPSEAPCLSETFTDTFLPCFMEHCKDVSGMAGLMRCAAEKCDMMTSLDQQCITCLVLADPDTALQNCLTDHGNRVNVPGLLLLSNLPIYNASVKRFVPDVNVLLPRAYISAEVEGIGTVICTHTTANLGPVYFEVLSYQSWAEQNMDETRALVAALEHVPHAVVMGDLNSSPEVTSTTVSPDMEGSLQYFLDNGFTSPYTDSLGICTWCMYNPIAHAQEYLILDHILLKNLNSGFAMRIFDKDPPMSDHYGIEVFLD